MEMDDHSGSVRPLYPAAPHKHGVLEFTMTRFHRSHPNVTNGVCSRKCRRLLNIDSRACSVG